MTQKKRNQRRQTLLFKTAYGRIAGAEQKNFKNDLTLLFNCSMSVVNTLISSGLTCMRITPANVHALEDLFAKYGITEDLWD